MTKDVHDYGSWLKEQEKKERLEKVLKFFQTLAIVFYGVGGGILLIWMLLHDK